MLSRRRFLNHSLIIAALPLFYGQAQAEAGFVPSPSSQSANKLVVSARKQIGVTVFYDGAYIKIRYPGGDVPRERGVCTDVIIRAYRDAFGHDLQKVVHDDMSTHFSAYPKLWGLTRPDSNIDHRRVPNLQTFLRRNHAELPKNTALHYLQPGDLVTMMLPGNLPHIAIVSDQKTENSRPLIIHNVGRGTREEDFLGQFPITGIYRYIPRS